ncbi:carboxylesterase [Streptomyces showdoensis]|uniref:Carboxylic ester hydrolase n=1 Tax=Streptomyces showdoensis TaxID=68268 RepID=A0A2P2GH34_STREW|nr:carboxylesterase [Streptomyces showdoensis]
MTIRQGSLRGVTDGGVSAFRGIPYAAPPVGRLRFRPPADHPGWPGVRDAGGAGPSVPQGPGRLAPVMGARIPDWDEAGCLNLNVWTPRGAPADGADRPRPVLLWFHGGGFTSGSGGWDWYDGARLAAAGDIVVVTANYRLGPLGYLHLPEAGADNLGSRDQAAALRWVRDTIRAFGGDPARITVGGQSAGAYSALALALDPETGPLVHRLILQSGPWNLLPQSPAAADRAADLFLDLLGIARDEHLAKALRDVPAGDLLDAYGRVAAELARPGDGAPPMHPVLGGAGHPTAWPTALADGALAGKGVLVGSTEHEATAFLGPDAPAELVAAVTRAAFGEGVDTLARECAAHGTPAHVYRFARVSTAVPGLGAPHCSDLPFAFDRLDAYATAPMLGPVDARDRELAREFSGALAAFTATGDPGWPAHRPEAAPYVRRFARE